MVAAYVDSLAIRSLWAGAIVVNKCAIHQSALSPPNRPSSAANTLGTGGQMSCDFSLTGAERLLALQGRS
jgi:hypothetical protein